LTSLPGTAWLAVPDFQQNLYDELGIDPSHPGKNVHVWGDLVYREGNAPRSFWNRTTLKAPFIAEFKSIGEAATILKGIQRNWAHYPVACFRRAELIKEKLPYVNEKPRAFPYTVPLSPMGVWSLIDEHTLLASAATTSPFPCGEIRFEEDHVNPPSRAYMKMYEALAWVSYLDALARHDEAAGETDTTEGASKASSSKGSGEGETAANAPKVDKTPAKPLIVPGFGPGTRVIDAGACPGGWTWVFDKLGATVTAIDRSPLAPDLMTKPNITFLKHDAFTLKPADFGPVDWVCSDVICYPPRLLEWIREWLDSDLCQNFICTIKMQGAADHETTRAFADIPGSRVVHLTANKNELTWIHCGKRP
jgi:23S rRNA (cytidine2498-2'-O)-methyltransferase